MKRWLAVFTILCGTSPLQGALHFEPESPVMSGARLAFTIEAPEMQGKRVQLQCSTSAYFEADTILLEECHECKPTVVLTPLATALLPVEKELYCRILHPQASAAALFVITAPESYVKPKKLEQQIWNMAAPYFLPENHPVRPALDEIFSASRATLSIKALKKAGFLNPKPRKWTHLIVTRHPQVPGYIFKIYLDSQRYFKEKPEYIHWIERIQGVLAIQNEIEKQGWQDTFKTPQKWIYPLPEEPAPPKEFVRKYFILVEEDMDLYSDQENYSLWKSEAVTFQKLDRFYHLLKKLGLHDCAKPDNAPFSRDGKIAFIDTQSAFEWPVLYKKLEPYLSEDKRDYWKRLTKK